MTENDWTHFAAVVPAGTYVKYKLDNWITPDTLEGILLENKPYASQEITSRHGDVGEDSERLRCQAFYNPLHQHPNRVPLRNMRFRIGDLWLMFSEVMALEASS